MIDKPTPEDIAQGLAILSAVVSTFEERAAAGTDDPQAVMEIIKSIVGAALSLRAPKHNAKKPLRGLGYTFDDAIVVAHLADFDGNMSAALRAHYPNADEEQIKVHANRIRSHTRDIVAAGMPDYVG